MNTIPHGKIGGLPAEVREELNRRLFAGAEGPDLLAWLNALPEVRAVLESKFEGRPILQQNLSKWRQGAFQMWVVRREAAAMFRRDMAAVEGEPAAGAVGVQVDDDKESGPASLQAKEQMDMMAYWLAARFSLEFPQVDEAEGLGRLRLLERMTRLLTMLRRENHASIRIDLMREQGGGAARPARSLVSAGGGRGQSSREGGGAAAGRSHTANKQPAQEGSPAQVGSGTCTPPAPSRPGGKGMAGMTVLEGPISGRMPSETGAALESEEEDEDFDSLLDRLADRWADVPIGADGRMEAAELARHTTPADQAALLAAFPGWDLERIFRRLAEVRFDDEPEEAGAEEAETPAH